MDLFHVQIPFSRQISPGAQHIKNALTKSEFLEVSCLNSLTYSVRSYNSTWTGRRLMHPGVVHKKQFVPNIVPAFVYMKKTSILHIRALYMIVIWTGSITNLNRKKKRNIKAKE